MKYYFPSILSTIDFEKQPDKFTYTVNSGENAIKLLLRSFALPPGAKIAIPLFVCDSLKRAVIEEGFIPFYLDLKTDGTFWSDLAIGSNKSTSIAAAILVHLYGFIHPDTNDLMNFCKDRNLPLIHDAAQSYGIDESTFTYGSIIYSFGPGKSSTAAGGAIIKGLTNPLYLKSIPSVSDLSIQAFQAKLFLKSRIYGYTFNFKDKLMKLFFSRFFSSNKVTRMTPFQEQCGLSAIAEIEKIKEQRIRNYTCLKDSIALNKYIDIAYEDGKGLYFKIVLKVKIDPHLFKIYLENNNIPFFCLFDNLKIDTDQFEKYRNFLINASKFIELSTEGSLPMIEIERIAIKLKHYSIS